MPDSVARMLSIRLRPAEKNVFRVKIKGLLGEEEQEDGGAEALRGGDNLPASMMVVEHGGQNSSYVFVVLVGEGTNRQRRPHYSGQHHVLFAPLSEKFVLSRWCWVWTALDENTLRLSLINRRFAV